MAIPTVPEAFSHDEDGSAPDMAMHEAQWDGGQGETGAGAYLQSTRGGDIAVRADAEPREWLFPGADETFRSIYTRAGTGFAPEVLAICSAITGEGKTTVGVGLAVT